jgi:hypothetical protein
VRKGSGRPAGRIMDPHKLRMRHSSKDANWRTPPKMVAALQAAFPIVWDLAADATSAIGPRVTVTNAPLYLGPGSAHGENALTVAWARLHGRCGFLNPPYSVSRIRELQEECAERIRALVLPRDLLAARIAETEAEYAPLIAALRIENWADKAYQESLQGFTTIGVFPYAPQTQWFRRYVMGHQIAKSGRGMRRSTTGACRIVWRS